VQDWSDQSASSIASEICGFIIVLSGTILLHATREQEQPNMRGTSYVTVNQLRTPNWADPNPGTKDS